MVRLLLGGPVIGGDTLSRFFALHVFVIPGALLLFLAVHLWLVLKRGVSAPPEPGKVVDPKTYDAEYEKELEKGVPFLGDAFLKDALFSALTVLAEVTHAAAAWRDVALACGLLRPVPRASAGSSSTSAAYMGFQSTSTKLQQSTHCSRQQQVRRPALSAAQHKELRAVGQQEQVATWHISEPCHAARCAPWRISRACLLLHRAIPANQKSTLLQGLDARDSNARPP